MQITINDELAQQTMQFFNTNNAQLALEKAVQAFLQFKKNDTDKTIAIFTDKNNSIAAAFEELKTLCKEENYEFVSPTR
jgi:Arc/MetJ family transcription regulator